MGEVDERAGAHRRPGADVIEVDGVPFERVGVLVWARPRYAQSNGDAVVWECGQCGVLVARPPLHAAAHVRMAGR